MNHNDVALELDPLHDRLLDAEQPRYYPWKTHAVSPSRKSNLRQSEILGKKRRASLSQPEISPLEQQGSQKTVVWMPSVVTATDFAIDQTNLGFPAVAPTIDTAGSSTASYVRTVKTSVGPGTSADVALWDLAAGSRLTTPAPVGQTFSYQESSMLGALASGRTLDSRASLRPATAGRVAAASLRFAVSLVDATPPTISGLTASPATISPNNDGVNDATTLRASIFDRAGPLAWQIAIKRGTTEVRHLFGSVSADSGAIAVDWDGREDDSAVAPEGTYSITIQASDAAGNAASPISFPTINIDLTAPTISNFAVSEPYFSPNIDGIKDVTYFNASFSELSTWQMTIRSPVGNLVRIFPQVTPVMGAYYLWDGRDSSGNMVPEGSYTLTLAATDAAGNSSSQTVSATVDVTAPSRSLVAPIDGSNITATVTTSATASDGNGVATTSFWYRSVFDSLPGAWHRFGTITGGGTTETSLPSHLISDGPIDLSVTATDVAGNTNAIQVLGTVTVANADELSFSSYRRYEHWDLADSTSLDVDILSGNAIASVTLLHGKARGPAENLTLVHNLRSRDASPWGFGWLLQGHPTLDVTPSTIEYHAGDGTKVAFERDANGEFAAAEWHHLWLEPLPGGGYEVTDNVGSASLFDSLGWPISTRDRAGRTRTYVHDATGRLTGIRHPSGTTYTIAYDSFGRVSVVSDGLGHQVIPGYAVSGILLSLKDPLNNVLTFQYDTDLNLKEIKSPEGRRLLIETGDQRMWDSVSSVRYGGGLPTSFTSSSSDWRVRTVRDATGRTNTYRFANDGTLIGITDGAGKTTDFSRNSARAVVLITNALGQEWSRTVDNRGHTRTITDQAGKVSTFDFVGDLQIRWTDPLGNQTSYEFDPAGNIVALVDRTGARWAYTYDAANNILSVTAPDQGTSILQHDAAGRLVGLTTAKANAWSFTYDAGGNILSATDPLGHISRRTYDAIGRLLDAQDANGAHTQLTFDKDGNVLTVEDPLNRVTTFEYDLAGRLSRRILPSGAYASQEYDAAGRPFRVSNESQAVTAYVYDEAGRISSVTDPGGRPTSYTYDDLGRIATQIEAASKTGFEYDAVGRLAAVTEPRGYLAGADPDDFTTRYTYDGVGQQVAVTDPMGSRTTRTFDAEGRQLSVTTPAGNVVGANPSPFTTTAVFDGMGRQIERTEPSRGTSYFEYDTEGNLVESTDFEAHVRKFTYDGAARLVQVEDPTGGVTTRTLDAVGRVVEVRDPRGNVVGAQPGTYVTGFEYDLAGQLIARQDALGARSEWTYDSDGRVKTAVDPRGTMEGENRSAFTSTFSYTNTRLSSVTDPAGAVTAFEYGVRGTSARTDAFGRTEYTFGNTRRLARAAYPGSFGNLDREYDATGNISGLSLGSSSLTMGYDVVGRLTDAADAAGTSHFTFDEESNLTASTGRAGTMGFEWSAGGVPTQVTSPRGITAFTYSANDTLSRIQHENGNTDSFEYDDRGLLEGVVYKNSLTGPDQLSWAIEYDIAGNLTAVTDTITGETRQSYERDASNRPVSESYRIQGASGWTTVSIVNEYDADGNRIRRLQAGDPIASAYTYDGAAKLVSYNPPNGLASQFTYDSNGNMLSSNGSSVRSIVWAPENRVTSITDGVLAVSYEYDAAGRFIRRSGGGGSRNLEYQGAQLAAIKDTNGTLRASFVHSVDGAPLSITLPGEGAFYYHMDPFGSVERITSESGQIAAEFTYDIWGKTLATAHGAAWTEALSVNPYQYGARLGFFADVENGLYLVAGKPYDPAIGRFLTRVDGDYKPCWITLACKRFENLLGSSPGTAGYSRPHDFTPAGFGPDGMVGLSEEATQVALEAADQGRREAISREREAATNAGLLASQVGGQLNTVQNLVYSTASATDEVHSPCAVGYPWAENRSSTGKRTVNVGAQFNAVSLDFMWYTYVLSCWDDSNHRETNNWNLSARPWFKMYDTANTMAHWAQVDPSYLTTGGAGGQRYLLTGCTAWTAESYQGRWYDQHQCSRGINSSKYGYPHYMHVEGVSHWTYCDIGDGRGPGPCTSKHAAWGWPSVDGFQSMGYTKCPCD